MTHADIIYPEARPIPVVRSVDVVVVGGGIAGIAAALAAARSAKRTILIEKQSMLGGLATSGLVTIYLPLCDGYGHQVIGGIGEELLRLAGSHNTVTVPENMKFPKPWQQPDGSIEQRTAQRFQLQFEAAPYAMDLGKLLRESGAEIWYDTLLTDSLVAENHIQAIMVHNKSGNLAIRAQAFVDASGDADLCALAGEETVSSDQNRRSGWYYSSDRTQIRLRSLSDPLYKPHPKGSRFYRGDSGKDVSQYIHDMHSFICKDVQKRNEVPLMIPNMAEFRMTRRLKSTHDLAPEHAGQYFDDTVGLTGDWRRPAPVYAIPLRSLHGSKINNLLAAGRCMGATGDAWDVLRVIPPCAVTGEAAGIVASAICNSKSIDLVNFAHIRQSMVERDIILDRNLVTTSPK